MDSIAYTRTAMSGWVFLATVLIGFSESRGWDLRPLVKALGEEQLKTANLLLGALLGIGAPPAVGFLLDRLVSVLFHMFGISMVKYPQVKGFKIEKLPDAKPAGLFHMLFYTEAGEGFISWTRRRRANVVGSATSALALIIGCVLVTLMVGKTLWVTWVGAVIIGAVLGVYAWKEHCFHRESIGAWCLTIGKHELEKVASNLGADRPRESRVAGRLSVQKAAT